MRLRCRILGCTAAVPMTWGRPVTCRRCAAGLTTGRWRWAWWRCELSYRWFCLRARAGRVRDRLIYQE